MEFNENVSERVFSCKVSIPSNLFFFPFPLPFSFLVLSLRIQVKEKNDAQKLVQKIEELCGLPITKSDD